MQFELEGLLTHVMEALQLLAQRLQAIEAPREDICSSIIEAYS